MRWLFSAMRHARSDAWLPRLLLAGLITASGLETVCANNADAPGADPRAVANVLPQLDEAAIPPPAPPTDEQLADDAVYQFIVHHATVHYVNTGVTGNLARWRGGRQSICPQTIGLSEEKDAFVTARLRALAAEVGAPVQSDPHCKSNVQITFTNNPQDKMEEVRRWAMRYFRNRYAGGMRDLIAFKGDHAIQGWYLTTRGGSIVRTTDVGLVGLDVQPLWPQITQKYSGNDSTGSRLGGGSGSGIGIGVVILVVDASRVTGFSMGAIADYLGVLTLSLAQSPDHCDALPSILDLLSSSCGGRDRPGAVTAGDLAFLKALYYRDTGLGPSLSRDQIKDNMMRQFRLSRASASVQR